MKSLIPVLNPNTRPPFIWDAALPGRRYAAALDSPRPRPALLQVEAHVEEALAQLGILAVANSIAVPGPSMGSRGISGGERRRVAVAVELVVKPKVPPGRPFASF